MTRKQHWMIKNIAMAFALLGIAATVQAQRDTTRKQTIDINSSYKPVLRSTSKINFSGAQLTVDTSRPNYLYSIPSQNLVYAYQPVSLKPLALQQDTNLYLGNRRYVKAGFGNYTTPYLSAGLSFGDGKTSLVNITGDFISSKGNAIQYQDYSRLNVKATASYFGKKNEVYAGAAYRQDVWYLYGYDHNQYNYSKTDIQQKFQEIVISGGIKNTQTNAFNLSYDPHAELSFFTSRERLSETTVKFDAPVEKLLGDTKFALRVDARADLTSYSTIGFIPNNIKINNNLFEISPSLVYASPQINFHGGFKPVWNNGEFAWLPDIHAEAQLPGKTFMLQGGWVGRYTKNTYRNLSEINPYLAPLTSQVNTRETEFYGGVKATLGKHFNVSAKAGLVKYRDLLFFINDTATDNKAFRVTNEPTVNDVRIHGDISYINQDKFTFNAGLTFNGYTGMDVNARAWNTVPMEFTSSLRWWAFEKLLLKGDFYMFAGGNYLDKGNISRAFTGGSDLSAGAEYKINKQFSAWLDVNNIFDNKYQRWHNYQVYGINAVGGILIHF